MSGQLHAPVYLSPGKIASSGWVVPRSGLDAMESRKILPLPSIEPRPSRPSPYRLRCHRHRETKLLTGLNDIKNMSCRGMFISLAGLYCQRHGLQETN
jgi:hypothetical protein